jgi:hypothetical protein
MAGRPTLLTPETHKAIVAAIRAGAYDWIAAQANGVDRQTFLNWMRRGERERINPYLNFRIDVLTARAQARLSAEIEVRKDQPFNWLRFGPGREREDAPGWTETKEVKHSGGFAVVQSDEWLRIAAALDLALEPYPEARLAVARTLQGLQSAEAETVGTTLAELPRPPEAAPDATGGPVATAQAVARDAPAEAPAAPTPPPVAKGKPSRAGKGGPA